MGVRDHLRDLYRKFPNWFTLARIAGSPLLIPLLMTRQELFLGTSFRNIDIAFVLCIVLGLTDLLDGLCARIFNQKTLIGAALDPVADKIYIWTTIFAVGIPADHFTWTIFVFAVDVSLLILGVAGLLIYLTEGPGMVGANIGGKGKFISLCMFAGSLVLIAAGITSVKVFGVELVNPGPYIHVAAVFAIGSIVGHFYSAFLNRKA
ncbi:MAG: CDP-alcohol phosphatidyltransferase family protein [Candidatus Niyogibacteria bacterium]|nr:CDP-alcohol phosphatidyltransferase family protein [Candidatus Niyogibacteria bacterium]